MTQKLVIGTPLKVDVIWYDTLPVPPKDIGYDGEVIGWRPTQVIVRVEDYAVLRFYKKTGLEVGNRDHARRGFRIDTKQLNQFPAKPQGVEVYLGALESSDANS